MKASGSITVYNNYSTASVKLIKNTRFQTPAGLIFRVPADVVIPGKQGSTPGQVTVTVFADQVGQQYNIGPTPRLTVPGLQSNAAMYAQIYANRPADDRRIFRNTTRHFASFVKLRLRYPHSSGTTGDPIRSIAKCRVR